MARVIRITEQFQRFVRKFEESFWGDLYGSTKQLWKQVLEEESARLRDVYLRLDPYERSEGERRDYRNGFYYRDFVTRFGVLRLKIARPREQGFLPKALERFQRRAAEVMPLIREAFRRGISIPQSGMGRVVAILTGEVVSAQTVSNPAGRDGV